MKYIIVPRLITLVRLVDRFYSLVMLSIKKTQNPLIQKLLLNNIRTQYQIFTIIKCLKKYNFLLECLLFNMKIKKKIHIKYYLYIRNLKYAHLTSVFRH